MHHKELTKQLVDTIKKEEENQYGITFDIETPTVIEFFNKNLLDKELKLKKIPQIISLGVVSGGFVNKKDSSICILAKDYEFYYFIKKPINYILTKLTEEEISNQEVTITSVTYHEIRHIVQSKLKKPFTDIEVFYNNFLDKHSEMKSIYDVNYHNSFYHEIDANLYSASKCKQRFEKSSPSLGHYFEKKYT